MLFDNTVFLKTEPSPCKSLKRMKNRKECAIPANYILMCTITDQLLKTVKYLNFKIPTLTAGKYWERRISSLSLFLFMSKMSSKHDMFASSERTTETHQAVYLQLLRNGLLTHSPSSRAAG